MPEDKTTVGPGQVGLTARTVPAGWWNGSPKLSLALGLRPCDDEGCPPIDTLPSALFSALKPDELTLEIKKVILDESGACPTPEMATDVTVGGKTLDYWTDRILGSEEVHDLNSLWQHVIPAFEGQSFDDFFKGLSDYFQSITDESAESTDNPKNSIGDLSGQIAIACQIERALVERMAIQNASQWKERVTQAAVRTTDQFLSENEATFKDVLEERPITDEQKKELEEKEGGKLTSMAISIRRERAAAAITENWQQKISQSSQALGQALCGTQDVESCREMLRAGPPDKNFIAGMIGTSFESILKQLLYLNQVNIRGSAMGAEEAAVIKKAAQDGMELESGDMPQPEQDKQQHIRLYATRMKELESNSEFARLFGLIHDFELTREALGAIRSIQAVMDPFGKEAHYFMIRIVAKSAVVTSLLPKECSNWTFAKLADEDEKRAAVFSPVSRQEIVTVLGAKENYDARDCEVLPVLDGVRLLSALNDGKHPAYELSSINPRDAMQDLDTRLASITTHVAKFRNDKDIPAGTLLDESQVEEAARTFAESRPPSEPWPLAALKSRSLRLYHLHQHSRNDCELGRTKALLGKGCEELALDSEDLSIGILYDAAVRCFTQTDDNEWHALCAANISYSDKRSGGIGNLDEIISGFFQKGERPRYQRAGWALSQLVKRTQRKHGTDAPAGASEHEEGLVTVADELVYEYAGEQQGSDNFIGERESGTNDPYMEEIQRIGLIDINRSYNSIADLEGYQKPPELLNGLGHYFGARDIHVGGGSTSDEATKKLLSSVECAPVPRLIGESQKPGHRLLRTEKIARPLVLLNGDFSSHRTGLYVRRYEPNTTRNVILRSELAQDGTYRLADKNEFNQEKLIVVPGNVDLELAYRHGVLNKIGDIRTRDGKRPRDGLPKIRMDGQGGGWATLDNKIKKYESNNDVISVITERRVNDTGASGDGAPSNGIFLEGGRQNQRKQPYYPDPLHGGTAFRLRTPGTTDDWIGQPWFLRQAGDMYTDVVPISITISRSESLNVKADENDTVIVAGIECIDMYLNLPPGLDAELVVWPVPDLAQFAISTEVVTLQAMVALSAKAGLACIDDLPDSDTGEDAIFDCLADASLLKPDSAGKTCGIACAPAPGIAQLKEVAKTLHQALQRRPLDVVCGHSIVNVTHAVDKPKFVPVLADLTVHGVSPGNVSDRANPNIFARRSDPENGADKPMMDAPVLVTKPEPIDESFIDEGELGLGLKGRGTDVDLAGYLEFDPLTTGCVEIDLTSVNPVQSKIDDEFRSRGKMNIINSKYPKGKHDGVMQAGEIYGFDVNVNETVTLKQKKARMARIENIPAFSHSMQSRDLQTNPWKPEKAYLSLHPLFSLATNSEDAEDHLQRRSSVDGITIDVDPVLNFSQSRHVGLRCRAIGRFMAKMTPRATKSSLSISRPNITNEWDDKSKEIVLPVPSSRRPDPPVPAVKPEIVACPHIVEKIEGNDGYVKLIRQSQLRLSFKRPFFSSGQEERIGIVLSPRPSSFAKDGKYDREFNGLISDSDRYRLDDRFPNPQNLPADLVDQLTQFADKGTRPPLVPHPQEEENGPYGLYPIPLPILRDGVFDELGQWIGANKEGVDYVENAQLPIYADSHDPSKRDTRPEIFFPVDLLTYEPHFDVSKELWYCNVGLNAGRTLDPHLQLGVVRFQPLAPRDLQVSPVGESLRCKVLPQRETIIKREIEGDNLIINVTTTGRAAESESDGKDLGPKSLFTARLTGTERHGEKIVHRHLNKYKRMNAKTDVGNSRTARFDVPLDVIQKLNLVIEVEEIEERYAGTQKNEPVQLEVEQDRQTSGPVYRASVDITAFVTQTL